MVQVQKVMNNHNNHPTVQSLSPKLKSQFPNLLPQITKYCKEPRIASSSSSKQINKIIPVIAILGHFDHGKTTLLDALGATNCLSLDFNGVTQSVRTQLVPLPILMNSSPSRTSKYWVTFVDTPGQEFFYRMRNFGASVADAVVLVVSVQEGVCLQTEESIGIVESMNVPVIVVINKIDTLPDNEASERITQLKSLLSEYKALSSASFVTVSALKKTNLDQLQHTLCQLFHQSDTFSTSTDFETPIFEWPSHYFNHINQIMTVAAAGEAQNKIKFDQLDKCKSTGVLLNLWKNKIDGTAMHILLNQGTVSGHAFPLISKY